MIDGELQVIDRDGQSIVVDQSGDEVVCRRSSQPCGKSHRKYHRLDVERFDDEGIVRPSCDRVTYDGKDFKWLPRRRIDLKPNWEGCSYRDCYGDYHPTDATGGKPRTGLAATLAEMSVEEFDAIVGDRVRADGGFDE